MTTDDARASVRGELSVDESVQFGRAEVVPFDGLWHRWEVRCYTPTGHLWSTSHHRHQVRAAVKADQFVRAGFFRLDPSPNASPSEQ